MKYIILSLDGNVGGGKSYLLKQIRKRFPAFKIVDEPVGQWTELINENGENMLELFYKDKKRWGYTFQTCALLTRQKNMQAMIEQLDTVTDETHIIITERSILTDKHIFADMLHRTGYMSSLEWDLYNKLFDALSQQQHIDGVIYVSTSALTSKDRIQMRGRPEEETISIDYLNDLDKQHEKWLSSTTIPVCSVSTEPGSSLDTVLEQINNFVEELRKGK
jgi:deoxyadenosine/deoxycytidine kinase